ncbi:MAG: bifunctional 3,4-dihydroxy-2-butanone-4-phosphate synthase/GTP cyclohydrolase II [Bacteroidetes bacterium 4572_77]|nr:MAG: bifunctional 3,4-dihydroxy-2-butanone-4-phosphate synthase/GTP cyclohydrolase II [Bacteroidetes bacterium 4572_77]
MLNTIDEAIQELVSGKMIIVMDDEDRENEGDLIIASEFCTNEVVNFMSTEGKGLICVSITEDRANELELNKMVMTNTAIHDTNFTVSVDYRHGTTTGISANDRAATIRALINGNTKPSDLMRPGHIFPLVAKDGGVLRRAGHTEATVDLMKLAGFIHVFRNAVDDKEHVALTKGEWTENDEILTRVHSECLTGDVFGSLRCDCGSQVQNALKMIEAEGRGILLYMRQEGRGIGLVNKIKAYTLQENGLDTVDANIALGFDADERDYGIGAQILCSLGVKKLKLMSNNPAKKIGLEGYGIEVVETVQIEVPPNDHNYAYLCTKKQKMGHTLKEV